MLCTRAEVLVALGKTSSISEADLALLDMVHPLAESSLKNYLQQNLGYSQHVEFLPIGQSQDAPDPLAQDRTIEFTAAKAKFVGGRIGTEALQLKHLPVALTGLEVREDIGGYAGQTSGSFGSDTVLTLGSDYYLDLDSTGISRTGIIYRVGVWPTEPRSVKATYYAGYSAAQLNGDTAGDIKLAAIETVAAAFKRQKDRRTGGPVTSESIGKYSVGYSAGLAADASGANFGLPISAIQILQPFRNYGRLFS